MQNENPKALSLIREAKIPEKWRSLFYSLPLFVSWLPGILWEQSESASFKAAKIGFLLACLYLFFYGVLYFLRGFFIYWVGPSDPVLLYAFFTASTLISLLYFALSLWTSLLYFSARSAPAFLERLSNRLENFLSR